LQGSWYKECIALQVFSDPVVLVLNAIERFCPPHLKKGDLEFEASVVIRSCILLLEKLMKISPEIRPRQKKKQWKLPLIGVKKIES